MLHRPPPKLRSTRVAVAALCLLGVALLAPGEGARLLSASGDVELGRGEPPVFRPADTGEVVGPGEVVRTGSVFVTFSNGDPPLAAQQRCFAARDGRGGPSPRVADRNLGLGRR